jgi:hypothetical protein
MTLSLSVYLTYDLFAIHHFLFTSPYSSHSIGEHTPSDHSYKRELQSDYSSFEKKKNEYSTKPSINNYVYIFSSPNIRFFFETEDRMPPFLHPPFTINHDPLLRIGVQLSNNCTKENA